MRGFFAGLVDAGNYCAASIGPLCGTRTVGDAPGELQSCLVARPEDAMRCGADAVVTYLAVGTGDTAFEAKEIARNAEVARECERIGMPLDH